jgi:hypothetical protein
MCFPHEDLKKIQKIFYQIRKSSVFGENINVSFPATVESVLQLHTVMKFHILNQAKGRE